MSALARLLESARIGEQLVVRMQVKREAVVVLQKHEPEYWRQLKELPHFVTAHFLLSDKQAWNAWSIVLEPKGLAKMTGKEMAELVKDTSAKAIAIVGAICKKK